MMTFTQYLQQKGMEKGIHVGRQEGIQTGIQLGRNEGRQEATRETTQTIARNMLNQGCEISLIHSVTGLTDTEIEKLKA